MIGFVFTTLRDWFKKLAPLFHPIRSKIKTNRDHSHAFSRTSRQLHVIDLFTDTAAILDSIVSA